MTVRYSPQGCRIETVCIIQPNGTYTENVYLSVEDCFLSVAPEESAGTVIGAAPKTLKPAPRYRR